MMAFKRYFANPIVFQPLENRDDIKQLTAGLVE